MNKILLILTLALIPIRGNAQRLITTDEFHWEVRSGVSVVEFWVVWNKSNEVSFMNELEDCKSYRYTLFKDTEIRNEFKITAAPTLIVFKDGEEEARFNPNIMMQLDATKIEVQRAIDKAVNKVRYLKPEDLTDYDRIFR